MKQNLKSSQLVLQYCNTPTANSEVSDGTYGCIYFKEKFLELITATVSDKQVTDTTVISIPINDTHEAIRQIVTITLNEALSEVLLIPGIYSLHFMAEPLGEYFDNTLELDISNPSRSFPVQLN